MKQIKLFGRSVVVKDDNLEKALRKFKKKIEDSGIFNDIRAREFYEKPTTERKRKKGAAKARWQRYLQAQKLPKKMF